MVTVTAGNAFGLNMADLDFSRLYGGIHYQSTSKLFQVTYANGAVDVFRGKGFKYNDDGEPTAGTVTSFAEALGNDLAFSVKGVHASAKAIGNAAATGTLKDDYKIIQDALDGNDTIRGGAMSDTLFGYDGNDKISGGGGPDVLFGWKGADHFIYTAFSQAPVDPNALEYIGDFKQSENDKIDLSKTANGLEFGVNVDSLSQNGMTIVGVDMNDDGNLDMAIQFRGAIDFKASDFIL